jgi:hypothetical protein
VAEARPNDAWVSDISGVLPVPATVQFIGLWQQIQAEVYTLLVPQLASRGGFSPTICRMCVSSPTTCLPGEF